MEHNHVDRTRCGANSHGQLVGSGSIFAIKAISVIVVGQLIWSGNKGSTPADIAISFACCQCYIVAPFFIFCHFPCVIRLRHHRTEVIERFVVGPIPSGMWILRFFGSIDTAIGDVFFQLCFVVCRCVACFPCITLIFIVDGFRHIT